MSWLGAKWIDGGSMNSSTHLKNRSVKVRNWVCTRWYHLVRSSLCFWCFSGALLDLHGPSRDFYADRFLRWIDELIEPPCIHLAPNQLTSEMQQKTEENNTKALKPHGGGGGREAPAPFAMWFQCFCMVSLSLLLHLWSELIGCQVSWWGLYQVINIP